MPWYNENIDAVESASRFRLNGNQRVADICSCWRENHGQEIELNEQRVQQWAEKLGAKLTTGWRFFSRLRQDLMQEGITIQITKSQLQGLGANLNRIRACLYVSIIENIEGCQITHKILNIGATNNSAFLEVRPVLSYRDIFTEEEWQELEHIIGWRLLGQPTFTLGNLHENDILYKKLITHFKGISSFLQQGGVINPGGQSAIEATLYEDSCYIMKNQKENGLLKIRGARHGQNLIPLNNGAWGEIDISIDCSLENQNENQPVTLDFEIQGPEHYGLGLIQGNAEQIAHRIYIDRQKIQWCQDKKRLFVWMDWETLMEYCVMNGRALKNEAARRRRWKRAITNSCRMHQENPNGFIVVLGTLRKNRRALVNDKNKKSFIETSHGGCHPIFVDIKHFWTSD